LVFFARTWTPQEAFLRKDAILLFKEATTMSFPDSRPGRPAYLNDLDDISSSACLSTVGIKEAMPMIAKAGFYSLNVDKPIILYSVARFRMTTNSSDRIDAIM
jgi:hypothetical protein